MARLKLSEACLLEASGELGAKASAKLREKINKYPAALLEYEITRGNLELLRSLPKVQLTPEEQEQIASKIKVGVQQKLWQQQHAQQAKKRWQVVYRVLAGVSAAAACLVIGFGAIMIYQQHAQYQLAQADDLVSRYIASNDQPGNSDSVRRVMRDMEALQRDSMVTNAPGKSSAVSRYFNDIDITPEDEQDFAPTGL